MKARRVTCSIVVQGDEPPTEFRIFTAGKVETTKGEFLFDAAAAEKVIAEYLAHGIDLMIDYDHASLASISIDPANAGKAAGWFNIELRAGELWAVNVRWTPPAAEALKRKEWRFMSPAFQTEEGRIVSLLNVAITNLPATRRLEPLMAASSKGTGMDAEAVMKALDALEAGDLEACKDLLKGMIAGAAAGEPAAEEPAPAPEAEAAAVAPAPSPEEEEKKKEEQAASAKLMRVTDTTSLGAAIEMVDAWRASHLELETERQKLALERATLEAAERRRLCAKLVTDAGEAPSKVWASEKADAPKAYLAAMPIADFRALVEDAIKAKAGKKSEIKPPSVDASGLTPEQLKICKETGCDPAVFASLKGRS